jgi:hypothetical protein
MIREKRNENHHGVFSSHNYRPQHVFSIRRLARYIRHFLLYSSTWGFLKPWWWVPLGGEAVGIEERKAVATTGRYYIEFEKKRRKRVEVEGRSRPHLKAPPTPLEETPGKDCWVAGAERSERDCA